MLSAPNHPGIQKSILCVLLLFVLIANFVTIRLPAAYAQAAESAGTNFTSTFNANHNGWTPVSGSWALAGSAYYVSHGISGRWSSISHSGTYSHLDYSVKMKRTGSHPESDNCLDVRGYHPILDGFDEWLSAYQFCYETNGKFAVWKGINTNWSVMKGLTATGVIHKGAAWNTLKVIAIGSSLKFFINGTHVWTGSNNLLPSGTVGVDFFRDNISTGNKLYVDSATMSTTATSAPNLSELAVPSVTIPGGDMTHSP